jgi:uroporphyrinogen decarboxylase
MDFQPDYRHFTDVMNNRRSKRLPLYEHIISPHFMERIVGTQFASLGVGNSTDLLEFFRHYCGFFKQMTYDVVSFEVCITDILPGRGALSGGKPGPIQTRADFNAYPWDELPDIFIQYALPSFDALEKSLPAGMKAVGGIGNGVFEISEDLVGLEYLPLMQVDDPELYADLFQKIGDTMCAIWAAFANRFQDVFVAYRFGDDLGFKSSLLTNPRTVHDNIIPQYRRVIKIIHAAHRPFLLHSCGCIFDVMSELIALGIDAKHSNEDTIAPFDRWIRDYGHQIGLLGGFDMDFLCTRKAEEVFHTVLESGQRFRVSARGYALGSGNSIPDYVPVENYLAMIRAAQAIRQTEA